MNPSTLNDLWIRIIETFTKGVGFALLAMVFARLSLNPKIIFRRKLVVIALCMAALSLSGFVVSFSLYNSHPGLVGLPKRVAVAWTQGPACLAAMVLAVYAVGEFPLIESMLVSWSAMHKVAKGRLSDLDVVHVKVRPLRRLVKRMRREKTSDATS